MKTVIDVLWLAALAVVLGGVVWWSQRLDDAPAAPVQAREAGFAVRDVRLFDGDAFVEGATVVVVDGRITAVGRDVAIPDGVTIVEGEGRTLLPGLIDAHTHTWGDAQRDALRFGVTTELEMMGAVTSLADKHRHREAGGDTDQADVFSAGAAVTVPGGHGTQYGFPVPALQAGDDVDAFVQARIAEGSDFIKLMVEDLHGFGAAGRMATLGRDQITAAIAAAHRHGKHAVVHVSAMDDAQHALQAGADGLVHVFVDAVADPALLASATAGNAFVVPILSVIAGYQRADAGAALAADARLQSRLTSSQKASLGARFPAHMAAFPALDRALQSTRRLHEAGVTILAGTDAGNPGTAHGASLHGELALLVQAGLTPAEALRAATSAPAARFGLEDRGRIAPGLRADLLLVEGDPGADITATRAIVQVWKNGYAVAAEPAAPTAAALADGHRLAADFESGDLSSHFGGGWQAASDQMMGGRSNARIDWIADGAGGSAGAMRVTGDVVATGASPWAGVVFSPAATPMQPVDVSARQKLQVDLRGTPGDYALVLLGAGSMPASHPITLGEGWQSVQVPLAEVRGAELSAMTGIAITRVATGPFRFDVDNLHID